MNAVQISHAGTNAVDPPVPVTTQNEPSSSPEGSKRIPVTLAPAPSHVSTVSSHTSSLKRVFIGPYPVKIAEPQIKRTRNVFKSVINRAKRSDISDRASEISELASRSSTHPQELSDDEDGLWRFIRAQARTRSSMLQGSLRRGGVMSDGEESVASSSRDASLAQWESDLTPGMREELVNRLKSNKWLPSNLHQQKQRAHTQWVGDTFVVGTDLFGAPLIPESPSTPGASSSKSTRPHTSRSRLTRPTTPPNPASVANGGPKGKGKAPAHISLPPAVIEQPSSALPTTSTHETYATARSSSSQLSVDQPKVNVASPETTSLLAPNGNHPMNDYLSAPIQITTNDTSDEGCEASQPALSDTHLLPFPAPRDASSSSGRRSDGKALPIVGDGKPTGVSVGALRSALRRTKEVVSAERVRKHSVIFANEGLPDVLASPSSATPVDEEPAPPGEVLARSEIDGELDQTSAGASRETHNSEPDKNSAKMADRMLVQICYSRAGGFDNHFDEDEFRRHPEIEEKEWGEFIVSWRGRNIELYQDHSTWDAWLHSTKNLVFLIPLEQGTTHASMFSHTDMTFCVSAPPVDLHPSTRKPIFRRSDPGTNIFIFKPKARSRAIDWIWRLRETLGGQIPPSIDVHVPALGTRVTFEIPSPIQALTGEEIISSCKDLVARLPEYRDIAHELSKGHKMALAWCCGTKLDWVWLEQDINGMPRDWSILFGLALEGRTSSRLEMRIAQHSVTKAKLADGTVLEEPESIEGYVYRLKPKSGARVNIYLSSHEGNLFVAHPDRAFPPPIPQAQTVWDSDDDPKPDEEPELFTRDGETKRCASQILHSQGYVDLRDIYLVRRSSKLESHHVAPVLDQTAPDLNDQFAELDPEDDNDSEVDEPGGEAHLSAHARSEQLKLKRSFEIIFRTGSIVRFEAHSVANAIDWVKRLGALIRYWSRRHRVDARVEMDLVHYTSGARRFEAPRPSRVPAGQTPPPPSALPDPEAAARSMTNFWSWCVLEGCRPIVKAGRLFYKTAPRKHYKNAFLVLIPGHVVLFHITKTPYGLQQMTKSINLAAAFVCSGVLAAMQLPYLFDSHPAPRRYQDGLETNDSDLDTTIIIRYRKQPGGWDDSDEKPTLAPRTSSKTPKTKHKHKVLILKTRSQLERDAWCWALNAELERAVRASVEREERLRRGV